MRLLGLPDNLAPKNRIQVRQPIYFSDSSSDSSVSGKTIFHSEIMKLKKCASELLREIANGCQLELKPLEDNDCEINRFDSLEGRVFHVFGNIGMIIKKCLYLSIRSQSFAVFVS